MHSVSSLFLSALAINPVFQTAAFPANSKPLPVNSQPRAIISEDLQVGDLLYLDSLDALKKRDDNASDFIQFEVTSVSPNSKRDAYAVPEVGDVLVSDKRIPQLRARGQPWTPPANPDEDEYDELTELSCGRGKDRHWYKLDKVIGQGSFGTVSECRDPKGTDYACKLGDKDLKPAFDILNDLKGDKRIPAVYEQCKPGKWFLVMELVAGENLRGGMGKVLGETAAKAAMTQILGGMAHVHSKGYAHNDLKPDNVMMSGTEFKIIDFDGASKGKPDYGDDMNMQYMSPDYKDAATGIKNDVWSLGMMYIEFLTGKAPWRNPNEAKAIWDKPNTDAARAKAVKEKIPQVSEAFSKVLADVFCKDSERIKNAGELQTRIAAVPKLLDECEGGKTRRDNAYVIVDVIDEE